MKIIEILSTILGKNSEFQMNFKPGGERIARWRWSRPRCRTRWTESRCSKKQKMEKNYVFLIRT